MPVPHRLLHWGPGGLSPARKSLLEAATSVWSQNNWREPRIGAVKDTRASRGFLYPLLCPLQTQGSWISNRNEEQRRLRRHQGPCQQSAASKLSPTHPGGLQGKAPPNTDGRDRPQHVVSMVLAWNSGLCSCQADICSIIEPKTMPQPPPPAYPEVAL